MASAAGMPKLQPTRPPAARIEDEDAMAPGDEPAGRRPVGRRRVGRGGFSLVEVIVVIGAISVLVGIALVGFGDVLTGARNTVAGENIERFNGAVWNYNQIASRITVAADAASTADEAQVLALLQTRDVTLPGSPFLPPGLSFEASGEESTYRLIWNGVAFQVLEPGVEGTGLLIGR